MLRMANTCFELKWQRFIKPAIVILAGNALFFSASTAFGQTVNKPRKLSIDFNWRFHLGDISAARARGYQDSSWRLLNLPHDWGIEGTYSKSNPAGRAGGFLPAGIGWYRKHLQWKSSWQGKHVVLLFEGVYMNSNVWINGHHLGRHPYPYGYTSFYYDITPYLRKSDNVIAVWVDNSLVPSARWYTGSGIYRHVWLIITNKVHIPVWGMYVTTPVVSAKLAKVKVRTKVENGRNKSITVTLETRIQNKQGIVVSSGHSTRRLDSNQLFSFKQTLHVQHPDLWSPAHPTTYMVESIVKRNGKIVDTYETRMGIRTFSFSADSGFVLNGQPMEIQGMAMHSGGGGAVGAAVPNDVLYYRLKMLKKMGASAIRSAHNPQSPEFYTICDTLGIMVMDELFDGWRKSKAPFDYGLYFEKWWKQDATSFIRRDRNHPSVIMWSIGNEVWGYDPEQQKALVNLFHRLDPTRSVTQGRAHDTTYIDIPGFNGEGENKGRIQAYHKSHPNQPIIGTEMTHAYQTRSVYHTQTWYRTRDFPGSWEQKNNMKRWKRMEHNVYKVPDLTKKEVFTDFNHRYQSSYDNAFARMSSRQQIRISRKLPYLVGTFRWCAFDYLGESYGWPARAHNSGLIDLASFPKDDYYLYQSQWSQKPMVHMVPSYWTWPGKKGVKIPVVVYTNLQSAELFLNGQSLGEKKMTGNKMELVWKVPYQPGTLKVVAKQDGKSVVSDSMSTAFQPTAVKIIPNRKKISANQRDVVRLEVDIVDSTGTLVPQADNKVIFEVNGPAQLIGVENGDILDLSPNKAHWRKAFIGKCLGLIQATDQPGRIEIIVHSEGLKPDTLYITSQPK